MVLDRNVKWSHSTEGKMHVVLGHQTSTEAQEELRPKH